MATSLGHIICDILYVTYFNNIDSSGRFCQGLIDPINIRRMDALEPKYGCQTKIFNGNHSKNPDIKTPPVAKNK